MGTHKKESKVHKTKKKKKKTANSNRHIFIYFYIFMYSHIETLCLICINAERRVKLEVLRVKPLIPGNLS